MMQDGICSGCRESSSTSSWDLLLLQVNSWNFCLSQLFNPKHRKKQRMLQWKWPFIVNLLIKKCDFPVMLLYQSVTHGFIGTLWLLLYFEHPGCCNGLAGRTSSNALRASLRHCDSSGTWAASLSVCDMVPWTGHGSTGWSFQVWNLYWINLNHVN